jgi:hypothetical protein
MLVLVDAMITPDRCFCEVVEDFASTIELEENGTKGKREGPATSDRRNKAFLVLFKGYGRKARFLGGAIRD